MTFEIVLPRQGRELTITPLRTPPALFNEIKFGVELGEEQHLKTAFSTVFFKEGSHTLEVGLGIQKPANATIDATGRATEGCTLPLEFRSRI